MTDADTRMKTMPFHRGACFLAIGFVLLWNATRVASLFYFGPPVTMLMAWAAFGDRLLTTDVAGLGIIAIGVVLTQMKTPARPGSAGAMN